MVFLHGDGRVARIEQVLTEDQFGRIVSGRTTREEVRRLIDDRGIVASKVIARIDGGRDRSR